MERSYFYDSTDTDKRIYQAADFARFHKQIIGNGVSNDPLLPNLAVEVKENMTVSLGAGYCFANGYMYENTTALDLIHDIAHINYDRIDRIVIRFDSTPTQRKAYAYVKKGTPAENPLPPTLQRDDYVFEMSVAQVRILAGKSYIEQHQIVDERTNEAVCGYIPLHNIYRGMEISEDGMVTMPNQSYVEIYNRNLVTIQPAVNNTLPINQPIYDFQNEINENKFIAKESGVFGVYMILSFNGSIPSSADIQASVLINNNDRIFLFARPGMGGMDNNFTGMIFKYLNKGDSMTFQVHPLGANEEYTLEYFRISIAKIS